ncbi:MAG: ferrous iron transport protein B [Caldisericaceae bacterium]
MIDSLFTIALAGNANVGKSVIFNQLTGGNQIIGNWPGKTVEKAEGFIEQEGLKIKVVDLPGIYSLSTYSEEEIVSREFIATEHPDLVVSVLDASNLERNLFFLLQIIELEVPIVVVLNQYDVLQDKGITIDDKEFSSLLGLPVVKTIATKNKGLKELFETIRETLLSNDKPTSKLAYGKEVEQRIKTLSFEIASRNLFAEYPPRFVAIKLIEGDPYFTDKLNDKELLQTLDKIKRELKEIHGEDAQTVIISERYSIASRIAEQSISKGRGRFHDFSDKLDSVLLHQVFGYVTLIALVLFIFFVVFKFGSIVSEWIEGLFDLAKPYFMKLNWPLQAKDIIWNGLIEGIAASFGIVLPYIAPFYLILAFLEDSGYLARIAFLTDDLMHRLGVHGKAFIPLIESFGCNVPAIMGTRVMERRRDRLIASVLATLVPCSARTVIIFGLVAAFLGPVYAILIYLLDFLLIFIVGLLLNRYVKGTPSGLIMEMPRYHRPVPKIILKQTWIRLKEFFEFAMPVIVVANIVMEGLIMLNLLQPLLKIFTPLSNVIGLPPLAGLTLFFGVLRKELTLIMLATFYNTTNFASVLTARQIFVFGFVTMIYIPCVATIMALKREFGKLTATIITVAEFFGAILLGALLNQVLRLFMR